MQQVCGSPRLLAGSEESGGETWASRAVDTRPRCLMLDREVHSRREIAMKRFALPALCGLAVLIASGGDAAAQYRPGAPGGYPGGYSGGYSGGGPSFGRGASFSYLNLLGGGRGSVASRYYGIVRPQMELRNYLAGGVGTNAPNLENEEGP